jgi:signal transduction histidine kinase
MDSGEAIRTAYEKTDRAYRVAESKVGCIVALVFVPAGVTLDYFVYPEHLAQFATLRLLCDLAILGMFALHFTAVGQRHIPVITFTWLLAVQAMIAYMIFATDGYQSTYYAGLNLAMIAVGILLPTSLREAVLFFAATLGLYVISCVAHPDPIRFDTFYNNLYFLILTGCISVTSVVFNARRRFSEFRLSYELDERNKQLAELDRLKSEFFANISHELRTPLTLILAPVEGLLQQRETLTPHLAGQLELVRQNALRLLRLVNDLLDVIRLEEGRLQLERRPIRFDLLLGGTVNAMKHLAESRGIHLEENLIEGAVWVRGDRPALEKVLFNLLGNALKFTDSGGTVSVTSRREGQQVAVTVRDDGIGIAEKDLPYVFERFRQADSSATRRYPGTGLGLALVKDLTERHGGEVGIRSRLGEGTAVTIHLPVLTAEELGAVQSAEAPLSVHQPGMPVGYAEAPNSPPPMIAEEAAELDTDGRPSILVVDDEDDMRRYLVELLSPDYRVLQAADGSRGLDMAQRHRPDLMLLDLMLPEIDGLEVCRRLKQSLATRPIRIVLLTARADETAKLSALNSGADDFLTKPFSGVEVQTRLANLLRGTRLERDLAQRNTDLNQTINELRETQARLVESEKINALGRLSAGLLHEINNPLNYALTALEVARNHPGAHGDDDLGEILQDIDEGMQRIRAITSELRAFAYPAKDQHRPFLLAEAAGSAIQLTAHESRDISIENDIARDVLALGSRTHIAQVLINLLSNAIRAVRQMAALRPPEIHVDCRLERERVVVTVRDNGEGIRPEALERIFDPFYTTQDVGEGMGMGLSICQTIIRNHGGELRARSTLGAGTEFSFDLPRAAGRTPPEEQDAVDTQRKDDTVER